MKVKYNDNWYTVTNITKTAEGKNNVYWLDNGSYVLSNKIEDIEHKPAN